MTTAFNLDLSRRSLLRGGAVAAAGAALFPMVMLGGCAEEQPRVRPKPLGLQLYTMMALLDADFDGTLAKVAALGYREVETLGSFGRDPAVVRSLLDKHGLVSPSQHIMPPGLYEVFSAGVRGDIDRATFERRFIEAFSFDRVEALIEACVRQAGPLGQTYIVWQIAWPSQLQSRAQIDQLIKALNRAAATCRREGFTLGYHNHGQEFAPVGSDIPFDLLLQNSDPTIAFELDLAWTVSAKADPLEYLGRYPDRFRLCHLKDVDAQGDIADAGRGVVPFAAFIQEAKAANVDHFFVEYDVPEDPMRSIEDARNHLLPLLSA